MKQGSIKEINDIFSLYKKEKYILFTGKLNLNIFGIRNKTSINSFNDTIGVLYNPEATNKEQWLLYFFTATTDPGLYHLQNPSRVSGTAILCPGQHRSAFTFGLHHGEYECLVQSRPLPVFRDANKNSILDFSNEQNTMSGIQIHRANPARESTIVDKWSAGCQVFADPKDFQFFMNLCKDSAKLYGNKFTYTLFE